MDEPVLKFPVDVNTKKYVPIYIGTIVLGDGSSIHLRLTPDGLKASVVLKKDSKHMILNTDELQREFETNS